MDAGLAKVMNSSVGTSTIKALDTLLKTDNTTIANNAADRLFNSFKNSAKLVGSDDVLFAYNGAWTRLDGSADAWYGSRYDGYETSSYITFSTSGTVIFKTIQEGTDTGSSLHYDYRVTDGAGNIVASGDADIAEDAVAEITCSVNVVAGSKYKFAIVCFEDGGYPNQILDICGKTILFAPTVTTTA